MLRAASHQETQGRIACLLAVLFAMTLPAGGPQAGRIAEEVDAYVTAYHDLGLFDGAVLVARGDSLLYARGFGLADRERGIPNTPRTKFRIGSLTKQFTTVMTLQLVEEGRLALSDRISKYLPDYRQDIGDRVTIDHLLRHMSGIPSYTSPSFWRDHAAQEHSKDDVMRRFLSGDLVFPPGSTYRYSNSNHVLLALIIEGVTGESFRTNLEKRITRPLSMDDTGAGFSDPDVQDLACGYIKSLGEYIPEPPVHSGNTLGTGGMYSTPLDFFAWNRAFEPGVMLSDSMLTRMFTHYHRINRFYGRGYAWNIYTIRLRDSETLVWLADYNGEFYGNWASITRLLDDEYLIVIMSNAGRTSVNADEVVNILYGKPYQVRIPIKDQLALAIREKGLEGALAEYQASKAADSTYVRRSERGINELGYELLREGRVEEALAILQLNVDDHPRSSNVWDSYAEALAASGDTSAAIANYERSLRMNPENHNARIMLERLRR